MKDLIVAVGGADCGVTPPMPFVGRRFDGGNSAALARLALEIALLRCGFDISDRRTAVTDTQELILQSNRVQADCIVVLSCGAFGSRKSFNDVKGAAVKYSAARVVDKARELAEDICAKLFCIKKCGTEQMHAFGGAACPAVIVEMGYLTCFDEAKLMHDPDYIRNIAEYATMGICEYFGMPYIPHSPAAYKGLHAKIGMRGKNIKLLQAALCYNGYPVDIDGVYGKTTDVAVKEFAINNDIKTDGASDQAMRALLFALPTDLEVGCKRNGVLYLQRKLNAKLYASPTSGTLCENTVNAINEFLTETGNEKCDGVVTERIFRLLSETGGGRPRLF